MQTNFERIDGTDFQVGSADHGRALAARSARHDAAYLERHHALYELNSRLLRDMPGLPDRIRTDANASAFIARDLVFVRAAIERRIYDTLMAARLVPVEGGHPRGAQSYGTRVWDQVGSAKVSHDLTGDAPRADVTMAEDLRKYVNVRSSYGYTVDDIERAAYSGTPLLREKAMACADAIARELDRVGRSGDAGVGVTGLLNNAGVTLHTLTNGEWTGAGTVAEILADFREIEQAVIAATRDTQPEGYVLLVPTTVDARLAEPVGGSTVTDLSIRNYLLQNARIVRSIVRWQKLDDAVTPDVAASDAPMGVLYPIDSSTLFWPFAIQYEEMPPEVRNLEWIVQARARCGGVEFRQPKRCLYVQNFD